MTNDLFSLQNRVALVTGGLGQLGQEFSLALLEYGARVIILDRFDDPNMLRKESLKAALISNSLVLKSCDISNTEALNSVAIQIEKEHGAVTVLVNAAAIDSPPDAPAEENGPFEQYPGASLDLILDVNIKGVWNCCQVFGKRMRDAGKGGSIINISSIYGVISPNQNVYEYKRKDGQDWYKPAAYSVSKSAILNLTRYLATYWAREGIRVNTISPAGIFNNQDEAFLKEYCQMVPMNRMAEKDEINGALIFLASAASSYVTGTNLMVDGGYTAW